MSVSIKQVAKDMATIILRDLGVAEPYVVDFEATDQVYLWDDGKEPTRISPRSELGKKIRELELRRNVTVYAVTHEELSIVGECYSFLCVSPYPEEWTSMFRRGASNNRFLVYAYVENVMFPKCSESGYVLLQASDGIIRRIE